jgi:hypothetical protein
MYLKDKLAKMIVIQKYKDISNRGGISMWIFLSIKLTIAGMGM